MDTRNPHDSIRQLASFGTLDDREISMRLSTGLDGFLERWRKESLPFIAAGGAELRFVEGPYGRGKTHFLQALEVTATREGFVTARLQCGTQHQPFGSLAITYRAIANSISAPYSAGTGKSRLGLSQLLAQISDQQLQAFNSASRGNVEFRNLVGCYVRRKHDRSFITDALRALLHADDTLRVSFADLYRNDSHLPRPLGQLGKRNAAAWLKSLLTLPRQLGYRGLIVLIDEAGADLHLRPEPLRSQQQHMANLRNMVDSLATGKTPGCAVIYATTNDFIQLARQNYRALSDRVERMEETTPFSLPPRNPRAIWCRLDELTDPAPDHPAFFLQLGGKLLEIAESGGFSKDRVSAARAGLPAAAQSASKNLAHGCVREFIKRMAAELFSPS